MSPVPGAMDIPPPYASGTYIALPVPCIVGTETAAIASALPLQSLVRLQRPSVTQFVCNTRVWQVEREVVGEANGELRAETCLSCVTKARTCRSCGLEAMNPYILTNTSDD